MNKIHKLGFAVSLLIAVVIVSGIVYFEGTRAVTIPIQPASRYPAAFAFGNISWPVVLVFSLSALVLLGPWMVRFMDTDPTPKGRRGTLFPFLRRPAFDRLLTLLNVGCILVTLMFLRRLYLIPDDVAYTVPMQRFLCIYGTMMFMVWTALVLVVEFSVWRAGRKLTILVAVAFMGFGMPSHAQTANNDSILQSIKDDIRMVKDKQKETRRELQAQERELRQLNKELDRARQTIQKEKQAQKDAKRSGRYYEPKRLERTFQSQYRVQAGAQQEEAKAKEVKEKPSRQKDSKKAAAKDDKSVQPQEPEGNKSVAQTSDANVQKNSAESTQKEKEVQAETKNDKAADDAKTAPANPRRISNKEAIRLQKQRNKYYEDRLKEKKKAEKAQQKADAKKQKEEADKGKEAADEVGDDDAKADKKAKKTKEQKAEEKKAKAEAKKAKAEEKKNSKKTKNNEKHEENADDAGVDDVDVSL